MKVLSLFSGIGAFEKALTNLNINYELVGFSEIDKFAIRSYCEIHNIPEYKNLEDIEKLSKNNSILQEIKSKEIDLITHGSPCQDFSIAGKQFGGDILSNTKSSLMWNTVDIIKVIKPKYVIWENVKNILSKKHRHNFDSYLEILEDLGYNNYYQVLNANDYGIPQNRERVYTISIRKDIDNGSFEFPQKQELILRLKDLLETEVDEKYYLSEKIISGFKKQKNNFNGKFIPKTDNDNIANSLNATMWKIQRTNNYIKVALTLDIKGQDCIKRVYDEGGISPTLTNMQRSVIDNQKY